jgi:hypothetical protein
MAHFCKLDENNVVLNTIVVADSDCLDENGVESEAVGIAFCKSLFGEDTKWVQTSWNKRIRKHYGEPGYTYDETRNAFIPPKYYESWSLNENTLDWDPPIPYPEDGFKFYWDESVSNWVRVF